MALTAGYSAGMRIELPSLSWADTHRVQDDAHTLTLPEPRPLTLAERLLTAADAAEPVHTGIALPQPASLTLTF